MCVTTVVGHTCGSAGELLVAKVCEGLGLGSRVEDAFILSPLLMIWLCSGLKIRIRFCSGMKLIKILSQLKFIQAFNERLCVSPVKLCMIVDKFEGL